MEYDKYELMQNSILKNIQELSELCVDSGIDSAYDLMDLIENYINILNKAKENDGKICLKLGE